MGGLTGKLGGDDRQGRCGPTLFLSWPIGSGQDQVGWTKKVDRRIPDRMWRAALIHYFYTLDKLYRMCNHTSANITAIVSEIPEGPDVIRFFMTDKHGMTEPCCSYLRSWPWSRPGHQPGRPCHGQQDVKAGQNRPWSRELNVFGRTTHIAPRQTPPRWRTQARQAPCIAASTGKRQLSSVSTEANRCRQDSTLGGELQSLREYSPKANHSLECEILSGMALNHLPLGLLARRRGGAERGILQS